MIPISWSHTSQYRAEGTTPIVTKRTGFGEGPSPQGMQEHTHMSEGGGGGRGQAVSLRTAQVDLLAIAVVNQLR